MWPLERVWRKRRVRGRLLWLAVWVAAIGANAVAEQGPAHAAAQDSATQPSDRATVRFDQRSPLSALDEQLKRNAAAARQDISDYDLANESFELCVPREGLGAAQKDYGLLVWISPFATGEPPPGYLEVLARHGVIWVAANNSGNDRPVLHRLGLALDAAHNVSKQYKVDAARTYVAGFSGGGRCASRLGVLYPDVFSGAACFCGCDTYRLLAVPGTQKKYWAPRFKRPAPQLLAAARRSSRFLLLTGDDDANRLQTLTTYRQVFRAEGYAHAWYVQVPGMGHQIPAAEWFEKAMVRLDEPLPNRPGEARRH